MRLDIWGTIPQCQVLRYLAKDWWSQREAPVAMVPLNQKHPSVR